MLLSRLRGLGRSIGRYGCRRGRLAHVEHGESLATKHAGLHHVHGLLHLRVHHHHLRVKHARSHHWGGMLRHLLVLGRRGQALGFLVLGFHCGSGGGRSKARSGIGRRSEHAHLGSKLSLLLHQGILHQRLVDPSQCKGGPYHGLRGHGLLLLHGLLHHRHLGVGVLSKHCRV